MNELPTIEDRLASIQNRLTDTRFRPASLPAKIQAGERLIVSYQTDLIPEWLVLDTSEHMLLLTPVIDDLSHQATHVVVRLPPNDVQALVCPQLVVAAPRIAFVQARRLEAIGRFYLEKANNSVRDRGDTMPEAVWAEDTNRFLAKFGAHLVEDLQSEHWRTSSSAPLPSPIPLHRSRKVQFISAVAVAACAIGLVLLPSRHSRIRSGEYAIRSTPGEVGVELRIDGRPCLAGGQNGSEPCRVRTESVLELVYRLDPGISANHLLVIYQGEGSSKVIVSRPEDGPLVATVDKNGQERCPEGFCPIVSTTSTGFKAGTISAYFARNQAQLAPLLDSPNPHTVIAGIIEYSFHLTTGPAPRPSH